MYTALLALAVLSALEASAPGAQAGTEPLMRERCDAAAAIVQREVRAGYIFETRPPGFTLPPTGLKLVRGWAGSEPSFDLIRKFEEAGQRSASECSEVVDSLRRRGFEVNDHPSTPLSQQQYAIRIGLPTVNDAGTEALVLSHSRTGGLGGGDFVYFMRKNAEGKWVVVGTKLLVIS